jgi:hypothetical protein
MSTPPPHLEKKLYRTREGFLGGTGLSNRPARQHRLAESNPGQLPKSFRNTASGISERSGTDGCRDKFCGTHLGVEITMPGDSLPLRPGHDVVDLKQKFLLKIKINL